MSNRMREIYERPWLVHLLCLPAYALWAAGFIVFACLAFPVLIVLLIAAGLCYAIRWPQE